MQCDGNGWQYEGEEVFHRGNIEDCGGIYLHGVRKCCDMQIIILDISIHVRSEICALRIHGRVVLCKNHYHIIMVPDPLVYIQHLQLAEIAFLAMNQYLHISFSRMLSYLYHRLLRNINHLFYRPFSKYSDWPGFRNIVNFSCQH